MEVLAIERLDEQTLTVNSEANHIRITNQASLQSAADFLRDVLAPLRKQIDETFEPMKKKAHEAHRAICEQHNKHLAPIAEAEKIVKSKIGVYMQEQERKRQEEQRRLEAEAQATAEQARLERIALEQQLGATEEEVQAIATEPVIAAPVFVPKVEAAGLTARRPWKARVTDKFKLIEYVSQHRELFYLLDVNTTFLNSEAKSRKDDKEKALPGVEFFQDFQTATRGA